MAFPISQDRWPTKATSVLERSRHTFKNPLLSDIKFAFPSVSSEATVSAIPAHKYVLVDEFELYFIPRIVRLDF